MISTYFFANKLTKFKSFFESRAFFFSTLTAVYAFHVLISSCVDIGPDTGIYIDIGRKIANGGKFYDDIFESNLPFNFYLYALQYKIYQWTGFNRILMSTFFIWLLFFATVFCAVKILKKTKYGDNKIASNLLLLSFFIGFLLRTTSIHFFEIGTKSSFIMCSLFLYLIYSFEMKQELSKFDLFCRGTLMAIMPCFKPHYIVFPILIEGLRFWNNKSWRFFIKIDNLFAIMIGLIALNWLIYQEGDYFVYNAPLWSVIYSPYVNFKNYFSRIEILTTMIATPTISILLITSRLKELDFNFKIFVVLFLSGLLVLCLEGLISDDQVSVFFFCYFIFLSHLFSKKEFWQFFSPLRNKFILFAIFFFSLANNKFAYSIVFGLNSIFWILWLLMPIIVYKFYDLKVVNRKDLLKFFACYFCAIIIMFFLIKYVNSKKRLSDLIILFNSFYLIFCCSFFEKKINSFRSPFLNVISVIIIFSSLLVSFLFLSSSIFTALFEKYIHRTPNYNHDRVYRVIKKLAPNPDDHVINFGHNVNRFPIYLYLGKDSLNKISSHPIISDKSKVYNEIIDNNKIDFINYSMKDIDENLNNPNYKLIIISNSENSDQQESYKKSCSINYLEVIFRGNSEITEKIKKNFDYLGVINRIYKPKNQSFKNYVFKNKSIILYEDNKIFQQDFVFLRKKN